MSQDEDERDEAGADGEAFYFASSAPAVATKVAYEPPAAYAAPGREPDGESLASPAAPQFAELVEEPLYRPLSVDYAGEPAPNPRDQGEPEESGAASGSSLFPESGEESQRDLDVPAFLRRVRF